jgi:addiction module RelE/StbE family toxin
MIEIHKHPIFTKHYLKRIVSSPKLHKQFKERFNLFLNNQSSPILHDHPLQGDKKGTRSFSISGNLRIIYQRIDENSIVLLDIGAHNQVYR